MKSKLLSVAAMTVGFLAFLPAVTFAGVVDYCPPTTGAPFDGGLSLLIAGGIAYASKKAYDKRKKPNQQNVEK